MESWSYVNGGGKGFVSSKNSLMGWELKSPCSFGNSMLVSGHSPVENHSFGDLSVQDFTGRQTNNDSIRHNSKVGVMNPIMATTIGFSGEDESSSWHSSSVVDSNNNGQDSSLIDLKLGRIADQRDRNTVYRGAPTKRVRMGGLTTNVAYCQVLGCNKDLSSSKDYHKRHKVCEVHSKTAKVIVNGIEQRFCQQCSRFHLLAEFDDGKRSCRKRLAGHNERRRKPQVGFRSGKNGRFLQSCNGLTGSTFLGTSLTATSFICQDILRANLLHPEKYGTDNWYRSIKVEQGTEYNHLSAIPITNAPSYSKSLFLSNDLEKPFPPFHENRSNATRSIFNSGGPNSGSRTLIHDTSLGTEDFTLFDTASTMQGLNTISESGCALSLLSSQPHNSSNHSSGILIAHPTMLPCSLSSYGQFSDKLLGVSSQASTSNKFSPSRMSSTDRSNQMGPILSDTVNFDITDGIYHGSDYMNDKDRMSCENGTTVNLLQLSSQLQRVEHQRQPIHTKPENDAFRGLRIT
ncbi:hypothetical protein ACFE04_009859 [Oxalis oulophora]